MASPGNQRYVSCIGTLSLPIVGYKANWPRSRTNVRSVASLSLHVYLSVTLRLHSLHLHFNPWSWPPNLNSKYNFFPRLMALIFNPFQTMVMTLLLTWKNIDQRSVYQKSYSGNRRRNITDFITFLANVIGQLTTDFIEHTWLAALTGWIAEQTAQ